MGLQVFLNKNISVFVVRYDLNIKINRNVASQNFHLSLQKSSRSPKPFPWRIAGSSITLIRGFAVMN